MIFAALQLQEKKSQEQHSDLCMTFVALTGAFDTVRDSLGKVVKYLAVYLAVTASLLQSFCSSVPAYNGESLDDGAS